MDRLEFVDPEIYEIINQELNRQKEEIELIASENFTSLAVMQAQSSVLTNKYAEGYPHARWYGGCEFVDRAEELAIKRAKQLFNAEHVNVQPHSGSQANLAVYLTALQPGDTVLAMDLACGGHLTHGHAMNFSGLLYNVESYGVNRDTEELDYQDIAKLAKKCKPKMILAGASAYSRTIDFQRFREICDSVGAYLFVDMAHIAGLVAAGEHASPVPYADFVTSTTHKTLRGPRGGMIICKKEYAKKIDAKVFPGVQGGPLMHVIAAKAVAFKEALSDDFKEYQMQVIKNAKALATGLKNRGFRIVAGGTDNHMLLVDLTSRGYTGKDAQFILGKANITINKNLIPYDKKSPMVTSGIRLGTAAVTTRGMKNLEMDTISELISLCLPINRVIEDNAIQGITKEVKNLIKEFPLYIEEQVST